MTTLYQISAEMGRAIEEITDNEGELTPELEAKIAQVQNDMIHKTDSIVAWVNYNNDLKEIAKKRIEELQDIISRIDKRLEKFDQYVDSCLSKLGANKIEGKMFTIAKRKPSMVVNVFDESLLPMEFINIPEPKPTVSKTAIAKALKEGKEVPGARLEESKKISISYKAK